MVVLKAHPRRSAMGGVGGGPHSGRPRAGLVPSCAPRACLVGRFCLQIGRFGVGAGKRGVHPQTWSSPGWTKVGRGVGEGSVKFENRPTHTHTIRLCSPCVGELDCMLGPHQRPHRPEIPIHLCRFFSTSRMHRTPHICAHPVLNRQPQPRRASLSMLPTSVGGRRARSAKLARVIAPGVGSLMRRGVPLLRHEDEPLLAHLLVEVRVFIPRPQDRTSRQDGTCARTALVRQAVGTKLTHDAHRAHTTNRAHWVEGCQAETRRRGCATRKTSRWLLASHAGCS